MRTKERGAPVDVRIFSHTLLSHNVYYGESERQILIKKENEELLHEKKGITENEKNRKAQKNHKSDKSYPQTYRAVF